jgi:hypothetical protein
MTNDDITKEAIRYMLERGLAHPIELERLSGRSKQIIRIWAQEYPDARDESGERIHEFSEKVVAVNRTGESAGQSSLPLRISPRSGRWLMASSSVGTQAICKDRQRAMSWSPIELVPVV